MGSIGEREKWKYLCHFFVFEDIPIRILYSRPNLTASDHKPGIQQKDKYHLLGD